MIYFGRNKNDGSYGFSFDKGFLDNEYEISEQEHRDLLRAVNNSDKVLSADKDGKPILIDAPEPTEEELALEKYYNLKEYLKETDWYAFRYIESQIEIPTEIKTKRQEARKEISELRNKYNILEEN